MERDRRYDTSASPPPLPQPSDKPEWHSLAYYNCGICKKLLADYIVNIPEEGGDTPIPVCSGCYFRTLNAKRLNKHQRSKA